MSNADDFHQDQMKDTDYREVVEGIRKGLESMYQGEGRDAEEVFAELEAKFGIADR